MVRGMTWRYYDDEPPMTIGDVEGPSPEPPYACPRIDSEGCETFFWWQGSKAHVLHMREAHGVEVPERPA